jgi:hypothetical protein
VECQRNNHDDFTESLLSSQNDLASAHMYFQVQMSIMTERFDSYMATLGKSVLPDLAGSIEEFDDIRSDITEELADMNAHPTCLAEWEETQTRYGRLLSSCSEIALLEITGMLSYHAYLIWYAEDFSNNVPLEGLEAFTYWSPLTDDDTDIILQINRQLSASLNLFLLDHYGELSWLENYIYDYFYEISYMSYFCSFSTIGRFFTETVNIVNDATDGVCSSNE